MSEPQHEDTPDPAMIDRNLRSLAAIGGVYDLLCLYVEKVHLEILTPWRLDTGARSAVEYLDDTRRYGHIRDTRDTDTPTNEEQIGRAHV